MKKILILIGPNLNMLGMREPEIYGTDTHDDVIQTCQQAAKTNNQNIEIKQSNHEGVLVDWIQEAMNDYDGIIINAAAYTHTSIAIHDALKLLKCPIIEVHLTDIQNREDFRHHSYITPLASHVITGKGIKGYVEALEILQKDLK